MPSNMSLSAILERSNEPRNKSKNDLFDTQKFPSGEFDITAKVKQSCII